MSAGVGGQSTCQILNGVRSSGNPHHAVNTGNAGTAERRQAEGEARSGPGE